MSRRERIAFLLEHYSDVLAGVRDPGSSGEHIPLMCRIWNHPSYQELERLQLVMRAQAPALYRVVVAFYVYPRFVRRAVCPRCGHVAPPAYVGELHRHGRRRSAAYVARMLRHPLYPVDERYCLLVVAWLDVRWRGDVYVPDELLPLVSAA